MKLQIIDVPGGVSLRDTDRPDVDQCRVIGKIYLHSDAWGILRAVDEHDKLVADLAEAKAALTNVREVLTHSVARVEDLERVAYADKLVREQLVTALQDIMNDIVERFDMESRSTNPGIKNCVEQARAALTAAGAT